MIEELLIFEIEGRNYGLQVDCVREVLRSVALSPAPSTDDRVEGVMNLRGRSVVVIDIRHHFDLAPRRMMPTDFLIVIEVDSHLIAIRVDRAELKSTGGLSLEPTDPAVHSSKSVTGVVNLDAQVAYLLDPRKLLLPAILLSDVSGLTEGTK